uniref:DUF4283 domain-containing protein n=1 Tax=Cajanus cajan TaxID=3821 RepID=A0A151R4P7_CAJCA|nr:hypothetical protein KK1_041313 [Cajanus cajan]
MVEIWQPRCGVSIQEISSGLFMFNFFHAMDMQKVLKGSPWSFDRHLLILGTLQPGDIPNMIPFFMVPFWILRIKRAGGEAFTILFKYECVGILCFFYGIIGHLEDYCDSLFALPKDDRKRHWNATL